MTSSVNIEQLSFGDYNVKLAPGDVPDKYKNFVTFDKMALNVRYDGFNRFDLTELVKVDKLKELNEYSSIALMLQIVHISHYVMQSDMNAKGHYKSPQVYDLFYRFYGLSKTFVKTCLQVYQTFWVDYYHPLYLDFSFSQLVEMLPLCKADMQKITADWSVRRIRSYKKELQEMAKAKLKKAEKKKSAIESDDIEDVLEEDVSSVEVKSSYVIDLLTKSASEVLDKCQYAKGGTSYKIFKKGIQAVLKSFAETISIDNTFVH